MFILMLFFCSCNQVITPMKDNVSINGNVSIKGGNVNDPLIVIAKDVKGEGVSFYLTRQTANTTLTQDIISGTKDVYVNDVTGCSVGQAINIYNENYMSQDLIYSIDVANNIITLGGLTDIEYKVGDIVECGEWNLAEDGSINPLIYSIRPPSNTSYHIDTLVYSFSDDAAMDISKFGGLPALTKPFIMRTDNGVVRNLLLITNNKGFDEKDCKMIYDAKTGGGLYGASCSKKI